MKKIQLPPSLSHRPVDVDHVNEAGNRGSLRRPQDKGGAAACLLNIIIY